MPEVYLIYYTSAHTPSSAEVASAMRRLRCTHALATRLCKMLHAMRAAKAE